MHAMKKQALCWALAGAAMAAAPAAMAAEGPPTYFVFDDTITTLTIDWNWDANTGTDAYYLGTHWDAWLTQSLNAAQDLWTVSVGYIHKDGPHGEGMEHPPNLPFVYTIAPGGVSVKASGVQDHKGPMAGAPPAHANAHLWNLNIWAFPVADAGGGAAFQVAHVPEPATWLMLIGGLAVVGAGARRRS